METKFPELNKNRRKMDMKRILVSFLIVASFVLLTSVASVSASPIATGDTFTSVEVDGIQLGASGNPAITAGESIRVRVEFDAAVNAQDVTLEVELETSDEDPEAETRPFVIESGNSYARTLMLDVPVDLDDELSDFVTLNIEISNDGYSTEESYTLRLQRESYKTDLQSVRVPQTVDAGKTFPVDIVLENIGYNDLEDVYVTASIPALGIERTEFFGDIVAIECDDSYNSEKNYGVDIERKCNEDDEDTVVGKLFLNVPFDAESGLYALDVSVENDDTFSSKTVQVKIDNAFSGGNFIVSGSQLLIVNPTNDVVVYRLVPVNTASTSVSLSEGLVAVPAGSSKMVSTSASSSLGDTFTYSVNVFSSDGKLVDAVQFTSTSDGRNDATSNPIVVLTIILAIIFVVLLVVLIVLIGKKPKQEDFGESYY